MSRSTLIALGAGGLSACFSLTVVLGPITALPLFLAGLGLGTQAGTIACATGFALAWVVGGAMLAGPYGLIYAIPALVVIRQALLHRAQPATPTVWYSAGGIVSTLTAFAMGLLLLAVIVLWVQGMGVVETLTSFVTQLINVVGSEWTAAERQTFVDYLVPLLPGLFATSWMLITLANAAIAQSLLVRMGRNLRPKGTLHEVNLPLWMSWLIVISAAVALAGPGELGYIGRNLALVAAMPFLFVGVSLVHLATSGKPWRAPALTAFYLALFVLGPTALLVAGIGIIDQWFGLRHRLGAPGNDQETE